MQDLAKALALHADEGILLSLLQRDDKPLTKIIRDGHDNIFYVGPVVIAVAAVILLVLTAIDITPRPQDEKRLGVSAAELRSIADQLVERATELRDSGALSDGHANLI